MGHEHYPHDWVLHGCRPHMGLPEIGGPRSMAILYDMG